MSKILITGGTGIIGSELIPELIRRGHEINVLSRSKKEIPGVTVFTWDVENATIEKGALEGVEYIIHLAGYSVSEGRWTDKRKKLIEDSRIKAIHLLKNHIGDQKLKAFVSASGVSYYGTVTSQKIFSETYDTKYKQSDYLAIVSHKWESAAKQFKGIADRTIIMRTPVVLSKTGGALEKISAPIKKGFGAALGSGTQWMPWVHVNDLVNAYVLAIENEVMNGVYNICAPEHVTNKNFTKTCAAVLQKKIRLPNVPGFLLKLYFGKMSGIVLKGSRVSGEKIKNLGFDYQFKDLRTALSDLLCEQSA